ncbi:MAG: DUF177 domain-containing protein [Pseudomonadota bacterium]|nr:DUF177 domain-containing protein [Pseudomonadota bacterium]
MTEFAHRLSIDQIRDGQRMDLTADEAERASVAKRLDLLALSRFEAHVVLARDAKIVTAQGRVRAQLDQACVATGDPVPVRIDEAFTLRFAPPPTVEGPEPEIELGSDELDTVFHDGLSIDLGEALADTLGLALNPYPRGPNAEVALKEAGVLSEGEAGPFAMLAQLKRNPHES